jgi:predicted metal-binding protein
MSRQAIVLVCTTCGAAREPAGAPPAGLVLARSAAASLRDAADVRVEGVRCLANCSRGPSAAIRCEGAWTYVFGHLDEARDGPALVAGARLLAAAADGLLPWRGRPEVLKRAMIARLPPADMPGQAIGPGEVIEANRAIEGDQAIEPADL